MKCHCKPKISRSQLILHTKAGLWIINKYDDFEHEFRYISIASIGIYLSYDLPNLKHIMFFFPTTFLVQNQKH